jgi:hypothetical protein
MPGRLRWYSRTRGLQMVTCTDDQSGGRDGSGTPSAAIHSTLRRSRANSPRLPRARARVRRTGPAPTIRTCVSAARFAVTEQAMILGKFRRAAHLAGELVFAEPTTCSSVWSIPFHAFFISLSSFLIWIRCFGLNGSDG